MRFKVCSAYLSVLLPSLLAISLVWLLPITAVQAKIYTWTDAQGKVHFSDKAVHGASQYHSQSISRISNQSYSLDKLTNEIPYSNRNGSMIVRASINGQSISFIIDTGAALVTIPPRIAQLAQIDSRKAQVIRLQTANGMTAAPLVNINSLKLHGIERQQVKAVIKAIDAQGLYGLLGMSFLDAYRMHIDHDRHVITLENR